MLLTIVLALAALGALWFFGKDLSQAFNLNLAFAATPSATSTRAPITVIITATRKPVTLTAVPPTGTRTLSATPRPTLSPTLTLTLTRTATRVPGAPRVTETFTPVPTPVPVTPPNLVSPIDGDRIQGSNKRILLTFQPAEPIHGQEWYRVQVDYLDRLGQSSSWCAFTKESVLEFPRDFFDDSSPNVRSFLWRVNVVRATQVTPTTCDAPYDLLSAPSQVWTFYWY